MLWAGSNPRGLHADSPLIQQATARLNQEEALERCEMHSILAEIKTLKRRLRYLKTRANHWRERREVLLEEFAFTPTAGSTEDDEDSPQPDTEPSE